MLFVFSALVWGTSVKHCPQKVGKEHVLNDEDVVQILKKSVVIAGHVSLASLSLSLSCALIWPSQLTGRLKTNSLSLCLALSLSLSLSLSCALIWPLQLTGRLKKQCSFSLSRSLALSLCISLPLFISHQLLSSLSRPLHLAPNLAQI